MKWLLLLTLALTACASKPKVINNADFAPLAKAEDPVFPYGGYLHRVSLHIARGEDGKPSDFNFEGVAKTSPEALHLILLSPFHTTIMKIDETLATGKVSFQIYEDRIRKYQDKISNYYQLLRQVIFLKKTALQNGAMKYELKDAHVTIDHFEAGLARQILIENPNYTLKIEVEPIQ